jgi:hypothetical protein
MQCLQVANSAASRLCAKVVERLVRSEQLVEHIAVVRLLLADAVVRRIFTAGCIRSERVRGRADRVVPVLELEFALCLC